MARPRRIDEDAKKRAVKLISYGLTRAELAQILKVDRSTLKRECQRDKEFCAGLKQAEAGGALRMLKAIIRARLKDWKAAAWYLERKFPDQWCVRDRREMAEMNERLKQLESERRAANT